MYDASQKDVVSPKQQLQEEKKVPVSIAIPVASNKVAALYGDEIGDGQTLRCYVYFKGLFAKFGGLRVQVWEEGPRKEAIQNICELTLEQLGEDLAWSRTAMRLKSESGAVRRAKVLAKTAFRSYESDICTL